MEPERKVLVVDDNVDLAETLVAELALHGRAAVAAGSVRQALDLLDDDPAIGAVLSDVRMPEVDGLDFRRVLKHRFPKLPVLLMTGKPVAADELTHPHDTVLQKPFAIEVLIATLDGME